MSTENKIRVTSGGYGAGSWIGYVDPRPNMVTDKGRIMTVNTGNFTVDVSGGGSETQRFYPHQLFIDVNNVSGVNTFSFPTGDGGVYFGHNGIFPNGPLTGSNNKVFASNGSNTVIETTR